MSDPDAERKAKAARAKALVSQLALRGSASIGSQGREVPHVE